MNHRSVGLDTRCHLNGQLLFVAPSVLVPVVAVCTSDVAHMHVRASADAAVAVSIGRCVVFFVLLAEVLVTSCRLSNAFFPHSCAGVVCQMRQFFDVDTAAKSFGSLIIGS